jgi:hypothetical protein
MLFLAIPDKKYKESYIQAICEFQAEGRRLEERLADLENDFEACRSFSALIIAEILKYDNAHLSQDF